MLLEVGVVQRGGLVLGGLDVGSGDGRSLGVLVLGEGGRDLAVQGAGFDGALGEAVRVAERVLALVLDCAYEGLCGDDREVGLDLGLLGDLDVEAAGRVLLRVVLELDVLGEKCEVAVPEMKEGKKERRK